MRQTAGGWTCRTPAVWPPRAHMHARKTDAAIRTACGARQAGITGVQYRYRPHESPEKGIAGATAAEPADRIMKMPPVCAVPHADETRPKLNGRSVQMRMFADPVTGAFAYIMRKSLGRGDPETPADWSGIIVCDGRKRYNMNRFACRPHEKRRAELPVEPPDVCKIDRPPTMIVFGNKHRARSRIPSGNHDFDPTRAFCVRFKARDRVPASFEYFTDSGQHRIFGDNQIAKFKFL